MASRSFLARTTRSARGYRVSHFLELLRNIYGDSIDDIRILIRDVLSTFQSELVSLGEDRPESIYFQFYRAVEYQLNHFLPILDAYLERYYCHYREYDTREELRVSIRLLQQASMLLNFMQELTFSVLDRLRARRGYQSLPAPSDSDSEVRLLNLLKKNSNGVF